MKKHIALLLLTFVFSLPAMFSASAQTGTDYEALFRGMELDELTPVLETLSHVVNEKKLENASLQIEPSTGAIPAGETLSVSLLPNGREITDSCVINYSSSDETVATVQDGIVTGVSTGCAEIKASVQFDDGAVLESTAAIEVFQAATTVKIPAKTAALINEKIDLKKYITLVPENASYQHLKYSVDNPELATIDENGFLQGKKAGIVVVTITPDGVAKPKSAKCSVSLKEPVTTVSLDATEFNIGKRNKKTLTATVGPESATDKRVIWSSENPKIASVTRTGEVTGVRSGTTVITCTARGGRDVSASAKVTVITAVSSVQFKKRTEDVFEGSTNTLEVSILPEDATNKKIEWESSDNSIATVDDNGVVTGIKTGKVTITATALDGSGKSASCKLFVEPVEPLYADGVFWETDWGEKSGRMGIDVFNRCQHKRVAGFKYRVRCISGYTGEIAESVHYDGTLVKPGLPQRGRLSTGVVPGFVMASKVEVTILSVKFTDGTVYNITEDMETPHEFGL